MPHARCSVRVIALLLLLFVGAAAHADGDVRVERGYHKGKRVRIQVVQIGWADVEVATARAFRKMEAAAARDGISLGIRSGFRSHERQQWLYAAWKAGYGNKAARPGYSNHESGRALDIRLDAETYAWLAAHGRKFGFHQTVRSEPWHWEYRPPAKRAKRSVTARASSSRRR